MQILHVIPGIAARYGGPSAAILGMCHALETQGVTSLIATTDADGPGRLPVPLGQPMLYQGVHVLFFPRQWHEGFKYSYPLARWLETHVHRFDVVHLEAVFSHASLAAARACRRQHIPYVVRPLGALAPWGLQHKRWPKRLLWHLGVRQMLHQAAAIHYATEEERHQAEDGLGLRRGVVIPLGIDLEAWATGATAGHFRQQYPMLGTHPYVLVLSRLHPVKGLEDFLARFLEVTRQPGLQHWRLVVAGDGDADYAAGLRRLVRGYGGEAHVLFTGWLPDPEKTAAVQEAALLALPSQYESFGLVALEALASGVPVLVSTHVNLAATIQAAGAGWVSSLERTAFLYHLTAALQSDDERVCRGAAGQALVRSRFTWAAVAMQLQQLYGTLLPPCRQLGR
jgi:glycosyltransferase involved in cell wall biosynthesis